MASKTVSKELAAYRADVLNLFNSSVYMYLDAKLIFDQELRRKIYRDFLDRAMNMLPSEIDDYLKLKGMAYIVLSDVKQKINNTLAILDRDRNVETWKCVR